jgi:hypothetical protein
MRLQSEGVLISGDKIDLKRFGHSFSARRERRVKEPTADRRHPRRTGRDRK